MQTIMNIFSHIFLKELKWLQSYLSYYESVELWCFFILLKYSVWDPQNIYNI